MKKLLLLVLLCCGCLFPLTAQADGETLDLYVTNLQAAVKDSYIILTWKNQEDSDVSLLVYIHTRRIDAASFQDARQIATLDGDKESFIYYPSDKQAYFFAVLYTRADGSPNPLFVEYRNITVNPVGVTFLGTEAELATKISYLAARAGGDAVSVTFISSRASREVILYRSTSPLTDADDLLSASYYVALDAGTTLYRDYPIPGIDYYYAVLDAGMVKLGQVDLIPGQNATVKPVTLQASGAGHSAEVRQSQRSLPLPLLSLTADLESGSGLVNSASLMLPLEKTIKAETAAAVEALAAGISLTDERKKEIEILEIDRITDITGEAYTLQLILEEYVVKQKYAEAVQKLTEFMHIKRAADVEARVRFYLGQLYYFQKLYDKALLEFLLASDTYYTVTQGWIDSCFQSLVD